METEEALANLRVAAGAYLDVQHMLRTMTYLEPGEYQYRLRPWKWDRETAVVRAYQRGATIPQMLEACELKPTSDKVLYDILDKYAVPRRRENS